MKKLTTLLFVLVFASSMAFAQNNSSTVGQNGNNNNAEIDQAGSLNSASVEQEADRGSAIISQDGAENEAWITQTGGGDAVSEITQEGFSNWASSSIADNASSSQYQEGDNNRALIGAGFKQKADISQIQDGNNNIAEITVNGPGTRFATVTQEQVGDNNLSVISGFRGDPGGENIIWQHGDDHIVNLQYNGGQKNGFDIGQYGSSNEVQSTIPGDGNFLNIDQGGHGNMLTTDQVSNSNYLGVNQYGDGNTASITQN